MTANAITQPDFKFPADFLFGAAVSAYQVEGAWNEDGKGESIWDRHTHEKMGLVHRNYDGDVAIDFYHRYEEDLDLLKKLGLKAYRFSISWPRILPEGTGRINQKGVDFYNKIIDGLLARGIQPMITLFHWDLPVKLQEKGGWANKEIVGWFTEYAKICFDKFGDRVKYWITMNEINVFTFRGYSLGVLPPCVRDFKMAVTAAHNAMVSHGTAVKAFRSSGRKGKIGVALDIVPKVPKTDNPEDVFIADLGNATESFFFYDPIIKGKYPQLAIDELRKRNYWPEDIDLSELDIISEKTDFFGINFYGVQTVRYNKGATRFDYEVVSPNAENVAYESGTCDKDFLDVLSKIDKDTDGKMPILISENGRGSNVAIVGKEEELNDDFRIDYMKKHIVSIKTAIERGIDVTGYMYWSAFDNFEWNWGFDYRFGLVYVDYENDLQRIEKKSFKWYKELIERSEK